ncbi:bifunctional 4-hydroxy-2-oxoglutarate aldolase/2-dehydro-3-deoxy-phosphogluconate aldolase [Yinghuangia sp. ASG 101]|uniref:bifunctional 4-hydroxy-2-oxoglutarate aldolase/2-dehydro-3-deoxy-phosphogluconate aldolase n=1 Tax=Yinghuangia sp. ASG 101 TaxID=2896848 RepID=UPI001E5DD883|nr:bifunctional 4-hydroxy-2-oxoglutarate aldolase/2-dehydro-3-deoxy-phosphogluconate aldolase [Yinghuangia sp. ASG 101]UGQ09244.1 bifunctional 4-hydroxy-2-oxoglutarate aldolase/2-dehydro-3-deoxy-phosphogluconate aldolase [Yinghuangia sp. ASG 101]
MAATTTFLDLLRAERVVSIVRGNDPEAAFRTVATLAEEGLGLIEVSLTTADAYRVIERAAALPTGATIGAGTVLTAEQARRARDAGAVYAVTPALGDGVTASLDLGLPVAAGALTPTEVVRAVREGATAVKLFPAFVGGPAYLKALREPLPDVPFVPTGGVDAATAVAYLEAGAVAVGVGGPINGDAPRGGDLAALRTRARAFLAAVRSFRSTP